MILRSTLPDRCKGGDSFTGKYIIYTICMEPYMNYMYLTLITKILNEQFEIRSTFPIWPGSISNFVCT